jgi:hypothetical protein
MTHTDKDPLSETPPRQETAAVSAASRQAGPVSIDLNDLQAARKDHRLRRLLDEARHEGEIVRREGRQHW